MDELMAALPAFGIREIVFVVILLIVVYMLVVIFRMKSLSASKSAEQLSSARYDDDLTRRKDDLNRFYGDPARVDPIVPPQGKIERRIEVAPINKYMADFPMEEPRAAPVTRIDQEKINRLERDVAGLREELDALRSAFAQSRDLLGKDIEQLKATQRVSPLYADSMEMAMAGASADDIAARCGIARAEAELVLSLAQGRGAGSADLKPGADSRYGSY